MSTALQKQHQKILRNLMKLPANKKCADCGEQCAVNVDTTNGIFLCVTCSGIHRDFGARIKSVSMASFTPEEIQKLQSTNNDEFNKIYMAKWKPSEDPFPVRDDSNYNARSAFLRRKYVEKVWYSKTAARAAQPAPAQPAAAAAPAPAPAAPQVDIFGNPIQQAAPTQSAPQVDIFGNPIQKPAQPAQPAAQQAWSPFGGTTQPAAQPAQPKNDIDDLFDLGGPAQVSPEAQKQQNARNVVKSLLDMMGPSTPAQNGPQGTNAFRQNQGFGGQPMGMNQGFGQRPPNQGGFAGQPAPMNQGFGGQPMNQGFSQPAPMNQGFGGQQPMNMGGMNQGGFNQQRQPNQGGFGGQPMGMNQGFGSQPMNQGFNQPRPQNQGFGGQPMNQGFGSQQPMNQSFGQPAPMNQGFGQPMNQGFGQPAQNQGFGQQRPPQNGGLNFF